MADHYLGNPKLKKANVEMEFTPDQIQEIGKCARDIEYFCEEYMKIVSIGPTLDLI